MNRFGSAPGRPLASLLARADRLIEWQLRVVA